MVRVETAPIRPDGYTAVARVDEVVEGRGKRVYIGSEAIALFRVGEHVFAVNDRCTHGRASLSEGVVNPRTCVLTCPWHDGRFDLKTGAPKGGPPRVPIATYEVRVEGERLLVRDAAGRVPAGSGAGD